MGSDQVYILVGFIVLGIVYATQYKITVSGDGIDKKLPWVGKPEGFLSKLRSRIASVGSEALDNLEAGYKKVYLLFASTFACSTSL
jgi:hypothetical protein